MDLFNDSSKAYSNATRRFVRQKSDEPVYIYRVLVARREMWAVLSAAEVTANKVSVNSCYSAVDGRYGLADAKERRRKLLEENPKLPYLIRYAKGMRQKLLAEEQLDKMGRDAEGVGRPPEVDSDSGQTTDPSY